MREPPAKKPRMHLHHFKFCGLSFQTPNLDGERHGTEIARWSNGAKALEYHWVHNQLQGIQTDWYQDGNKECTTRYKDSKRHGKRTLWNKGGTVLDITYFKEGHIQDPLTVRKERKRVLFVILCVKHLLGKDVSMAVGPFVAETSWAYP